jgi:hypothetical protein
MADDPNEWVAEEPKSTWADTANDFGRAVTNAATFGMGNRAKAYIEYLKGNAPSYTEGVDAQAKASEVARERSPYASIAGDVYGSLAIPGFGAEAAAARLGGGALARAGVYGGTGALTGAAQGAGSTYTGEAADYGKNALIGGALGSVLGGVGGAAFGRGPDVSRARVPSQDELWAAKNTGYGALGRSGARYEQQPLRDVANQAEQDLLADRFHWRDSPGTWRGIDEARVGGAPGQLNTGLGAPVSPADIDFVVKGLNKIPRSAERATDRESATILKRRLNDFIENPPPGAVLPGTEPAARQASTLARNARGDYAGYKRVQAIDELAANAANTAGATHSGLGLQAELRKGVRTFVKEKEGISPASKQGFNRDEIAALVNYTRPAGITNAMRMASNTLGGGGGIAGPVASAAFGAGGGAAGQYFKDDPGTGAAIGAAAPVLGMALRTIGNRRADRELAGLRDMIAQRTPLYDYRRSMSGMQPGAGSPATAKTARDAIATALIKQQEPTRVRISKPDDPRDWE